jgi:hypothetical protein
MELRTPLVLWNLTVSSHEIVKILAYGPDVAPLGSQAKGKP